MRPLFYMGKLSDFLARGVVLLADAKRRMRTLQVRLLAGEVRDGLEHVEPYGFTSEPLTDAEAFALFFSGERSHGIVFCVADRRYRLKPLQPGEVALYDDQGQKAHFTRDGIVVDTPKTLTVHAGSNATVNIDGAANVTVIGNCTVKAPKIVLDSPMVECTGQLQVASLITGTGGLTVSGGSGASVTGSMTTTGDVTAGGISLMHHTHTGDSGGTTGQPQ